MCGGPLLPLRHVLGVPGPVWHVWRVCDVQLLLRQHQASCHVTNVMFDVMSCHECHVWCQLTGQGSVRPVQILRPGGGRLQAEMLPGKTAETVQNMPEKLPLPLDWWNKLINYTILSPFTWQFWPGWWTACYRGTGHSEGQSTASSRPLQRCCWPHHSHCSQQWASGNLDLQKWRVLVIIYRDI